MDAGLDFESNMDENKNRPPSEKTEQSDRETGSRPRGTLVARIRKLAPWISLLIGIVSARMMNRGPDNAWMVALAAVTVWIALIALRWLIRVTDEGATGVRRRILRAARFTSLMATQSLVQLMLFFSLPFYMQAAAPEAGHLAFIAFLWLLSLCSLWDPLTEWILHKPFAAALLPATGSFVALVAVLPGLGFSTRISLWIAAGVATCGTALLSAASAPPEPRKRVALASGAMALALPLALLFGAAWFVPAAPLRLIKAEIGTKAADKWVADATSHLSTPPENLICATAIFAPLGLKDRLFHVWRKNGKHWATVELKITGGRAQGYRTHSRISGFGLDPNGKYTCTVQTLTGQMLGTRVVHIGGVRAYKSVRFPLTDIESLYIKLEKWFSSSIERVQTYFRRIL
jgi:hypothetical protein